MLVFVAEKAFFVSAGGGMMMMHCSDITHVLPREPSAPSHTITLLDGQAASKGAYRSHDIRSPTSSPFFVELRPRWSGLGTIPVKEKGIGVGGGATFILSFALRGVETCIPRKEMVWRI